MLQTSIKTLRKAVSDAMRPASMLAGPFPEPTPVSPLLLPAPFPHFVEDYVRLFVGKGLAEQLKVAHGVVMV